MRFGSFSVVLAVLLGACDYSADFLFNGSVEGVDDVLVLEGEGGERYLTPAVIDDLDDVPRNAIFAEVSLSRTANLGGATFEFLGTGREVCVFVDPEVVYWSSAVSSAGSGAREFAYPDNVFDDGDIDLTGGLSVFYNGTPGDVMGDFVVNYKDSLGNNVPVPLIECSPPGNDFSSAATFHGGRGAPEWCEFATTQEGTAYTVALEAWSIPLDDDRLSFGLILADGSCDDLLSLVADVVPVPTLGGTPKPEAQYAECFILGEALLPVDPGPHYGLPEDQVWPGSVDFELSFCGIADDALNVFCRNERNEKVDADVKCDWNSALEPEARCYCGDELAVPTPI